MKTLLILLLSVGVAFAGRIVNDAAIQVADIDADNNVTIRLANGTTMQAGQLQDVLKNLPAQATSAQNMALAKLQTDDELTAARRLKNLQAAGITIPTATAKAVTDRVETLRAAKEAALLSAAQSNPQRANAKMAALLARGLPITKATQDAVKATLPPQPAIASPTPEPNDGL